MASEMTSVRVPEDLAEWLRWRTSATMSPTGIGVAMVRATQTLQVLLDLELRRLAFTLPEACLMAQASNSVILTDGVGNLLFAEVSDMVRGLESNYAEHHGFESPRQVRQFVQRLSDLGPTADLALRSALTLWWQGEHEATVDGFAVVGIRVV